MPDDAYVRRCGLPGNDLNGSGTRESGVRDACGEIDGTGKRGNDEGTSRVGKRNKGQAIGLDDRCYGAGVCRNRSGDEPCARCQLVNDIVAALNDALETGHCLRDEIRAIELRKTDNHQVRDAGTALHLGKKNVVAGLRGSCRDRELRRRIENLAREIDAVFRKNCKRTCCGQEAVHGFRADSDSGVLRQGAGRDGQCSAATLRGKRVAAANLAANGFAAGENVEMHVAGGELPHLKGLRRSDRKGCRHGRATRRSELIKENVFSAQLIRKLFSGKECIRLRNVRLNDRAGRKRRWRLNGKRSERSSTGWGNGSRV